MDRTITDALFMHKNHIVVRMEITSDGDIRKLRYNPSETDHIPLGGQMNDMKFHEWWRDRATPRTRQGAVPALQRLGYQSTKNLLVDNLALSLTDCYWIKPYDSDITWEEVSLFSNSFQDYFGNLTFDPDESIDLKNRTTFSPAASQGEVQKKWCIAADNTRYMIKGNYGNSYQQSINEVFASRFHEMQEFNNAVIYDFTKIRLRDGNEGLGCYCDCFCNENIECISAWEVLQTVKYRRNESFYYPLYDACKKIGVDMDEFERFISYEIMADFLLSNTDRHMNNISILRNPDTLQIIGMAPIYDNGNSMFYSTSLFDLKKVMPELKTHSFIEKESELLKYVVDRSLVDLNKIDLKEFELYTRDTEENQPRIPYIKNRFEQKMNLLERFQKGKDIWKHA